MSFLADARTVSRALNRFYNESMARKGRVVSQAPLEDLISGLGLSELAKTGGLTGRRLTRFLDAYLAAATRLHHPGYMAHQVAVPHPAGSLAAMIDGFTNNAMAIYEMGPAAAAIEFWVINWMISKVGWTPSPLPREAAAPDGAPSVWAGGVLTNGGSLANLTALLAARGRMVPDAWEKGVPGDLALLAPPESHYSVARAAGILGLGHAAMYPLEVDRNGRILPDRIPAMFARVKADGRRPMALVGNACSTALGLYDPLSEIAEACRERGVWLHVDGAHGASALLSEKHRHLLRGVEKADSMVWDAHKLMRTPTLCAAVLVRDSRTLDGAFEQEASYLFHAKEQPGVDFIHRTVECTKAGLGLRFFAVLASLGEKGLAAYVERQVALAAEAYAYISGLPDFSCPAEPQTNILCFRIAGDDETQIAVRDALIADGSFHLSTAEVEGRRHLRATFMNPETSIEDVRRMIARVRESAARWQGRTRLSK
jgi:L-2,4-diaminobutyrate decarboxylase